MKQWRAAIRILKEDFPPLLPIKATLRHKPGAPELGYCNVTRDKAGRPLRFVVTVYDGAPWSYLRLVLLHEWAHALAWQDGHETVEDHGPEWALAYSRLYREIVEA